jgi:hypothetical protein
LFELRDDNSRRTILRSKRFRMALAHGLLR